MDNLELESHIEIVFQKEFDNLLNDKATYHLSKEGEKLTLKYPHSDTLVDIFSNIQNNENSKKIFVDNLQKKILGGGESPHISPNNNSVTVYASTVSLSFYTLIRLGFVEEAISSLNNRAKESGNLIHFISINQILSFTISY